MVEWDNTYQMDSRSFNDDAVVLAIQYGLRIRDRVQDFGCGPLEFTSGSTSIAQSTLEFGLHWWSHQNADEDEQSIEDM